MDNSQK